MNRIVRLALATLLALVAGSSAQAPPPAPPPESELPPPAGQGITVVLDKGSQVQVIGLAVPALTGLAALPGTAANAARELEQTLRRDLERSGVFEIVGPEELAVLTLTGDLERDADQYRSLGAAMLLRASSRSKATSWSSRVAWSTSPAARRSSASAIAAPSTWRGGSPTPSPTRSCSTSPAAAASP